MARFFERYSKARRVGEQAVGRVWSFRDVTERRRAERQLESVHQQLLAASRRAGMAEIATNVLHNVGNVLNSVNVSATLVLGSVKKSRLANLSKVVAMLSEHESDLATFLANDPKGQLLPIYLSQLAGHLEAEQAASVRRVGVTLQETSTTSRRSWPCSKVTLRFPG